MQRVFRCAWRANWCCSKERACELRSLVFYLETVNKVAIVCSCAESSVAVRRRIMQVGRILLVALAGLACWKTFTVEGSYCLLYVLLYNLLVSRTVQVDKLCQHNDLVCFLHCLHHPFPGVTFSLNGTSIPSNVDRISVTDFTVSTSNSDGLECRSELTSNETLEYTAGYLVADGDRPITAGDDPVILHYGSPERGWDTRRVVSGNHRFHYLRRREASSEGGYYTCNIIHDINNPAGLYILYPS